jgi:hypothetical protein
MTMTRQKLLRVVVAAIGCSLLPAAAVTACTGFLATGDDGPLFGNNEDELIPFTKMRFETGENGSYGGVYFGYTNVVGQGGMNEAGLVFDVFGAARNPVTVSIDRENIKGHQIRGLMAECATVADVLEFMARHNLAGMSGARMLMFADATGDSVIIEPNQIIRKSGAFQLITNFYQSEDPTGANAYGEGKKCVRFEIAHKMLEDAKRVNISDARKILGAVHMEGDFFTVYSNIYDLDDRLVYIYNFHDFANEVVIDLAEELKKGSRVVDLPPLFPRNPAREKFVTELERAGEKLREERGSVELPVETLERYVATYKGFMGVFDVEVDDGVLVVVAQNRSRTRLNPTSDTEFYVVNLTTGECIDVTFRLGDDAAVEGFDVKLSRLGIVPLAEGFMERVD